MIYAHFLGRKRKIFDDNVVDAHIIHGINLFEITLRTPHSLQMVKHRATSVTLLRVRKKKQNSLVKFSEATLEPYDSCESRKCAAMPYQCLKQTKKTITPALAEVLRVSYAINIKDCRVC